MNKPYPFNDNYIIFDDGRIYSKIKQKYLVPKKMPDGYLRCQINKITNGKKKMVYCGWHRVIAETFCDKPNPDCKIVNHIDGNKENNNAANLEWCTQKDNIRHAWQNGLSNRLNYTKYQGFIVRDTLTGKSSEYVCISDISRALKDYNYYQVRYAWKHNKLLGGRYDIVKKCND